ncbi:MAG: SpoIIE family protein phosphatase [Planctomycetota bacterium]
MKLISKIPMKMSVPLLLVVPVMFVAAVLTWVTSHEARSTAHQLTSANLHQIQKQIQGHLTSLLDIPVRINDVCVGLLDQGVLDPNDLRSWTTALVDLGTAFEDLSCICWGDEDGRAVWIARYAEQDTYTYAIKDEQTGPMLHEYPMDQQGKLAEKPSNTYEYTPLVRPWYTTSKQAGNSIWSEPFSWISSEGDDSSTLGIGFGRPYYGTDGHLVGVIDTELTLYDVSRYLESLTIGKNGQAFIIDRQNQIIASSTEASVVDSDGGRVAAIDSENPHIQNAAIHLTQQIESDKTQVKSYENRLKVGNEHHMLIATPFSYKYGIEWTIVTLVPESDFLTEAKAARQRSILITFISVLLILVIGWGLARQMVKPVLALVNHTKQIGSGNLDEEIHLLQTPELSQLSDAVNHMVDDLRDRIQLRRSLALAMEVQQELLPHQTPEVKGLDVAGHSTYCDQTGGDYYDFLEVMDISDSTVVVAVGDVMGHGVAAALLMATARGILRSRCSETNSLSLLLTHMNEHLAKDIGAQSGRFMTMLLMSVDAENKHLHYASAGHDPPFLYDPQEDRFHEFELGDIPLGIMENQVYTEHSNNQLRPGQIILAATDGVWEAQNKNNELFGKERVHSIIRENNHRNAEQISTALRDKLSDFLQDINQDDDITFVIIKVQ